MARQGIIFGLFLIICAFFYSEAASALGQKCLDANTCLHNGVETCGEDKNGELRRFLDYCDIYEYNCLEDTDFKRVDRYKCDDLPPIPE